MALVLLAVSCLACAAYTPWEEAQIAEHLPWGIPTLIDAAPQTLLIRKAYVASYNGQRGVSDWVAYHVKADYLNTPKREGKYSNFHDDPNVAEPVTKDDYKYSSYVRGHLAPYKIAGGDRNNDGCYAGSLCNDEYDEAAISEINYMTNIVPQYYSFNGSGGLWYYLETQVRDWIGDDTLEVWVTAGCIYWDGAVETIGPDNDIHVPDAFFKLIAKDVGTASPLVLAFLLPHQKVRSGSIEDYLVSVDLIEALTGFNFYPEMDGAEVVLEATSTALNWPSF